VTASIEEESGGTAAQGEPGPRPRAGDGDRDRRVGEDEVAGLAPERLAILRSTATCSCAYPLAIIFLSKGGDMSKRTSLFVSWPVMLAAVLLAGCGGTSGSTGSVTAKTGSLSKAQFIKQADAICAEQLKQADTAVREYLTKNGLKPTTHDISAHESEVVEAFLPAYQQEIDQIRSLGAPRGDVKQVSAILTALQWNVDEGKAKPAKFLSQEGRFATPAALAKDYGLLECA
jgi:hypothetical protein